MHCLVSQDNHCLPHYRACAEYSSYTIGSADDPLSPDPHPDDEGGWSEQELPYCLHMQTQLCNKDSLKDWLKNNVDNRQKKTVFGFFEQVQYLGT